MNAIAMAVFWSCLHATIPNKATLKMQLTKEQQGVILNYTQLKCDSVAYDCRTALVEQRDANKGKKKTNIKLMPAECLVKGKDV